MEPTFVSPAELVKKLGGPGAKPISKVLIANNGLAAVKFIRSVRSWAYETFAMEHAIKFIAMASPDDIGANAEFIKMSDHFVSVPGGTNNNNYANVDLIVELAKRTNADAVWAGWGHASENPMLPDKLEEAGIIFIGPPGNAMRLLGDKISSTIGTQSRMPISEADSLVAQSASVPCIEWSGSSLTVRIPEDIVSEGNKVSLPADLYNDACVNSVEEGLKKCAAIGFPAMIKASEGGGGKGIRRVNSEKEFTNMFEQVRGEVPGSPIFIMRLAENVRHLEVQLLGDNHDNIISIFSRDCSVQRRHQKVFEEAPVTVAPPDIIKKMEEAAVRLGRIVGYRSVGTVEYLYSPEQNAFFFLELNPRLQVEHPCTEMVSDVNLPASQLLVAMGIPLHNIPEIRAMYGQPRTDTQAFDFKTTPTISPRGHVIAARITAENADDGFKPGGGRLFELNFKSKQNVWGYFSVNAAGTLHEFADSQFGHIFAWGENREKATVNLIIALKDIIVRGEFPTPIEYLIKLLENPDFKNNRIHTKWLDNFIENKLRVDRPPIFDSLICGAIHVASKRIHANMQEIKNAFERGHIVGLMIGAHTTVDLISDGIKYYVSVTKSGPCQFTLTMNGSSVETRTDRLGTLISVGARSFATYMKEEPDKYSVQIDSNTAIFEKESDPAQLRTTSPGKLIRYLVEDGEHVDAGAPYVEVEVMKMVMTLHCSEAGIIHPCKTPGAVLENGDQLARLALDDPSKVRKVEVYQGVFPALDDPYSLSGKQAHQIYEHSVESIQNILSGYRIPEATHKQIIKQHVENIKSCLSDPGLPLFQVQQALSSISGRIPQSVETNIKELLKDYHSSLGSLFSTFPAPQIQKIINTCADEYLAAGKKLEYDQFESRVVLLRHLVTQYSPGVKAHCRGVLKSLFQDYLHVESLFKLQGQTELQVLVDLREKYKEKTDEVFKLVWAHWNDGLRAEVILQLLEWLATYSSWTDDEKAILEQLADLQNPRNAAVSLAARKMLIQTHLPSFENRRLSLESSLLKALENSDGTSLKELVVNAYGFFDALTTFFSHPNVSLRMAALEIYIRRAFESHVINHLRHNKVESKMGTCHFIEFSYVAQGQPSQGLIAPFPDLEHMEASLEPLFQTNPVAKRGPVKPRFFMYVAIQSLGPNIPETDEERSQALLAHTNSFKDLFHTYGLEQLTFCLLEDHGKPDYYTFVKGENKEWVEDKILRHLEEGVALELELHRLSRYTFQYVPGGNFRQHVYFAKGKAKENMEDKRFFVRCILNESDMLNSSPDCAGGQSESYHFWNYQVEKLLVESLATLEIVRTDPQYGATDCNHLCMNMLPIITCDLDTVTASTSAMLRKYGDKIFKLRVTDGEVIVRLRLPGSDRIDRYRWVLQNQTGFFQKGVSSGSTIRVWREQPELDGNGNIVLVAVDMPDSEPAQTIILEPYAPSNNIHFKRHFAQIRGTSYAHDIPATFHKGLTRAWARTGSEPKTLMKVKELFLNDKQELTERHPLPGENTVAMVAWRMTLFTPEYPEGRDIIVLANDITIDIGSFAVGEDNLFFKASEVARKEKIPRIYISVNSGARIGLADEVRSKFRIAWKNDADPSKGFNYLYLTPEDYELLNKHKQVVKCQPLQLDGELRYVITDVIGDKEIGVENLRGSGLIAGETSRAYQETFTISMVTCRTVGIGAYLVRLGQRVIQVDSSTILLTGCEALNKLLGRNVYSNNHQLGGPMIMYNNGVSHLTVPSDLAGVEAIINWLSYLPRSGFDHLPITPSSDPIERDIQYEPEDTPYDPRWFIAGKQDDEGQFLKGFFDTGSWTETMAGWAKNVVIGRARLGGLPIGVICVEPRTTEVRIPADPASPDSQAQVYSQAGQVWFPNSSFKTAQAIKDFNQEKLPLIIFANWRGFSGGTRDMFDEILKYGAYIVDNLVAYKQPVFVYIPPHAELRGGAWVVVDPTINSDMMEMYADRQSRGGILEPDGTVSVKFRKPDLIKAMVRLDPEYSELTKLSNQTNLTPEEKLEIKTKLFERERTLLPQYHMAALSFADLHDTPGRMKEKDTILEILEWKEARRFFAWRVRRRVEEVEFIKKIQTAQPTLTHHEALELLKTWVNVDWKNDKAVWEALQSVDIVNQIAHKVSALQQQTQFQSMLQALQLQPLTEDQRTALLAVLQQK